MSHSPAKQYYTSESNARHARHENGPADNYQRHHNNGVETMTRGYHQNGEAIPRSTYADRTYSLPRQAVQQQKHAPAHSGGYYTQDRRGADRRGHDDGSRSHHHHRHHHHANGYGTPNGSSGVDTPDFYFMPSQRKYSGEVVRVYVDYNKDPKN